MAGHPRNKLDARLLTQNGKELFHHRGHRGHRVFILGTGKGRRLFYKSEHENANLTYR